MSSLSFLSTLTFFVAEFYLLELDICWCTQHKKDLFRYGIITKAICLVPFVIFEYYLILCEHVFIDASHYMNSFSQVDGVNDSFLVSSDNTPKSGKGRKNVNNTGKDRGPANDH